VPKEGSTPVKKPKSKRISSDQRPPNRRPFTEYRRSIKSPSFNPHVVDGLDSSLSRM
jgi:hypothetical protein